MGKHQLRPAFICPLIHSHRQHKQPGVFHARGANGSKWSVSKWSGQSGPAAVVPLNGMLRLNPASARHTAVRCAAAAPPLLPRLGSMPVCAPERERAPARPAAVRLLQLHLPQHLQGRVPARHELPLRTHAV